MNQVGKKVAIVQSSYIPWKGYFDLINLVDEFILLDDVQYTKRDWRSRNRIKTANGPVWLSIPNNGSQTMRIKDVVVSNGDWRERHWSSISQAYARACHFPIYKSIFESVYLECNETSLSQTNRRFIEAINVVLGIKTKISWSMEFGVVDGKTERLVDLCLKAGATAYISGPAAKDYIIPELFSRHGISLHWMDYSGYLEYRQPYPPFDHAVSILDLIFSEGPDAVRFLKSSSPVFAMEIWRNA